MGISNFCNSRCHTYDVPNIGMVEHCTPIIYCTPGDNRLMAQLFLTVCCFVGVHSTEDRSCEKKPVASDSTVHSSVWKWFTVGFCCTGLFGSWILQVFDVLVCLEVGYCRFLMYWFIWKLDTVGFVVYYQVCKVSCTVYCRF